MPWGGFEPPKTYPLNTLAFQRNPQQKLKTYLINQMKK